MSTLTVSTSSLLAKARDGDGDALDALLREQRGAIEAVCRRRLRSLVDADDAVQETMVRAMRSLDSVRDPARLQSYLCRIAERVCLDMMRSGARPMPQRDLDADLRADEGPEALTLRKEEAELVRRTLQALSDRQAQALWLRDALGEPVPVVAETLGLTEGSARVLLTRARKQMRDGWTKVAALVPGVGFTLPAPLAKVATLGGLVPATVMPAVALVATAALVLPGLFATEVPPVAIAIPAQASAEPIAPQVAPPTVTAIVPSATTGATADDLRTTAGGGPGTLGGAPTDSTVIRGDGLMIGSDSTARVGIDNEDPRDDDVTFGHEDLLGVGSSLSDTLDEVGLPTPSLD